jgi:YgiT-type zinc finger domain-containing protein
MAKRASTRCDSCGKPGTRIRRVTRSYQDGKTEYLIRGIPVVFCPHCRESYLTADTLHELERIKLHHKQLAVKRTVPVAEFSIRE